MDLITILFVGGALFIIADNWEGKPKTTPDVLEPVEPESSKPEGLEPEIPRDGYQGKWIQIYSTPYGGQPPKMWYVTYNDLGDGPDYSQKEVTHKPTNTKVMSNKYLVVELSGGQATLFDIVDSEQAAVDLAKAQYDETQLGPEVDPNDKGVGPIGGGVISYSGNVDGGNPYGAGGPIG